MRAHINRVHVLAVTDERPFDIDVTMTDGLTVVRADNSMGKSTVANAILYALGGEGMLSPRWELPLRYCLYDHLVDDGGDRHRVLESQVTLELVDSAGRGLSVRRHVKSTQFQRDLVQLWDGLVLSDAAAARRRPDAFVRTQPAARQRGRRATTRSSPSSSGGICPTSLVTTGRQARCTYSCCCSSRSSSSSAAGRAFARTCRGSSRCAILIAAPSRFF